MNLINSYISNNQETRMKNIPYGMFLIEIKYK